MSEPSGTGVRRVRPFDLADPAFLRDPAPQLAEMRAAGEVIAVRLPLVGRVWVTTTHAATRDVLKDADRFAIRAGGKPVGLAWWMPRSLRLVADNMLGYDDPEHRRLRHAVDAAFARRNVATMREEVEARADRLLDGLAGETDLVPTFARRLPLEVIADLLGVPDAHRDAFARRASAFSETGGTWGTVRLMAGVGGLARLVREIIADVPPGAHGLVAGLRDSDLTADETVAMVFLLLFAGMETTTNLIAGSVAALEAHPAQKAWWLADPDARTERAVEELCRHVGAVAGTKPRHVVRDTSVSGVDLAQGEKVMALPLAANRDPAVFEAPDELRLDRFPNPHLAFGTGVHFCLGMQLARVEVQVALARLYARFPALHLAAPPDYLRRPGHRAIRSLKVRSGSARQVA